MAEVLPGELLLTSLVLHRINPWIKLEAGTVFQPMLLKIHCIDPLSVLWHAREQKKSRKLLKLRHNNMFGSWTSSVAISCAFKEVWNQNWFEIGVFCCLVCKSSSTGIVCPSKMETIYRSVIGEVCQPFSAFVFSYCYGKFWKLRTAPMSIGMKSQFSGILSFIQFCDGREKTEKIISWILILKICCFT